MTTENLLMENFEMLKALYEFNAIYPKTISFDEGEYFILHQTSARQRNWWQVVSMKGNIGFVPSNYVMKLKVEPEFLLGFLDSSIESLKLSKDTEINGIIQREELIVRLQEKHKQIKTFAQTVLTTTIDNPTKDKESSNSKSLGNGSVKNFENNVDFDDGNSQNIMTDPSKSFTGNKPEFTKKSLSSPAVSSQLPQLINESPSMGILTAKLDDITVKTSHHDNSIASEPSETTTTTTTSDEITTISKVEEIEDKKNFDNESIPTNDINPTTDNDLIEPIITTTTETETTNTTTSTTSIVKINVSNTELSENSIPNKIAEQDVYQIVDAIRQNTNLSHKLSCVALRVVLSELETILPAHIQPYLEPIAIHLTGPVLAPDNLMGETHDALRLKIIFAELAECKNDSEQRSWMLFEDEEDISRFLIELISILSNADPKICRYEMGCDQYQSTINLVLYYQMETRWTIRQLLLNAFKVMCHLDFTAVDIILSSVLPMELVEDMKASVMNVERLRELAIVLTMLFSIGQKMPVTHIENLGTEFVLFLLTIIETPPDEDSFEMLPDVMINLLLSFNLQFDDFTNSLVLEAMKEISDAKTFTEKILLLINREEDPVNLLKHTSPPTNSVLKMFVDLFSAKETASLFYMNDNKVLIDILVRQLSDLSPGDPMRRCYLELCRRILRNTNYAEHTHRKQDLMKIFTRIFCEETECSARDQQLVREIANEFPQIFKA